jgi:hypothetical protein
MAQPTGFLTSFTITRAEAEAFSGVVGPTVQLMLPSWEHKLLDETPTGAGGRRARRISPAWVILPMHLLQIALFDVQVDLGRAQKLLERSE